MRSKSGVLDAFGVDTPSSTQVFDNALVYCSFLSIEFLSQCLASPLTSSEFAWMQQSISRTLESFRSLLLELSIEHWLWENFLITGKGIRCTTNRRRVLDSKVVPVLSWLEMWQVDGLTSPVLAPLESFETGALARLYWSSVAWKDSVTQSFLLKSAFVYFG